MFKIVKQMFNIVKQMFKIVKQMFKIVKQMFAQSKFSEALHQVKKQHFKEQIWFWGP